ncbi:MAG: phosphoenolpyruvate--protein phosphotransferase [Treponema sp.]|jgi:phosphotransferase system enzyme I (PtsI)|nr:phosphoenolpyruvate--protein phosphotransferase [Treponema sp.]
MTLTGYGVSPGIATGKIHVYIKKAINPVESFISPGEEQNQLNQYLSVKKQAIEYLEKLRLAVERHDFEKAKIFAAHKDIVDDIVINEEIPDKITKERWTGDWAIFKVYETYITAVRKAPDSLIAERSADFEDVRDLLLRLWHGHNNDNLSTLDDSVIVAARELLPSDTASMDGSKILAILSETGGAASHSAIIARSYGIPAVLGIKGLLKKIKHGQIAVVNADEGTVVLDPDKAVIKEYARKSATFHHNKLVTETFLSGEARTKDKVKIDIGLNIANADDKELEAEKYADSAGLFRTEFIYMGRDTLPTEDEQFSIYRKVLECFGKRPVLLRTLDIGGDKPLASMKLPHEENPFLGNRALRFCFAHPDIFKTQIRAALRASVYGVLWLMLPMVASIDDIRKAKEQISTVMEELRKEGSSFREVKTGIMIEIPSIALSAGLAAKEVDFASIGSNDLCQYLCAADRTNSAVQPYYQSYHPAMFRLIKETASVFAAEGKPLSICGELGGDPAAAPALIGMGMRKLSMGAASIAAVKRVISSLTITKTEKIAADVLKLATSGEIKKYLSDCAAAGY